MNRPIRIKGEGISYHLIARCNNDEFLFQSSPDFELYLKCLGETQQRYRFELNNYTLMNSHVHLMVTTIGGVMIDKVIHHAHSTFAKRYNGRHSRKGHFWRDRYKSPIIQNDHYGLACMRYIHRNPIRAGMVQNAQDWPWSAYRYYAFGDPNPLITPFPSYLGLSLDPEQRRRIYQELVTLNSSEEEAEKRLFSGRLKWNSKQFRSLYGATVMPLLSHIKVA